MDWKLRKASDSLRAVGATLPDIPLPCAELETLADELLAAAGGDSEYPYMLESSLIEKCAREDKVEQYALESAPTGHYTSVHEEARNLLNYLANVSRLSELEEVILKLLLDGWTVAEIATHIGIAASAVKHRIACARRKIANEVSPHFWTNLHTPTVYRKPSSCCEPGTELCRNDQGRCPLHRCSNPR